MISHIHTYVCVCVCVCDMVDTTRYVRHRDEHRQVIDIEGSESIAGEERLDV